MSDVRCSTYLQDDLDVILIALWLLMADEPGAVVEERAGDPRHLGVDRRQRQDGVSLNRHPDFLLLQLQIYHIIINRQFLHLAMCFTWYRDDEKICPLGAPLSISITGKKKSYKSLTEKHIIRAQTREFLPLSIQFRFRVICIPSRSSAVSYIASAVVNQNCENRWNLTTNLPSRRSSSFQTHSEKEGGWLLSTIT